VESSKERFKAVARCERAGDLFLLSNLHLFWREALDRWVGEGAPPEIVKGRFRRDYFGMERVRELFEIRSGIVMPIVPVAGTHSYAPVPPIVPQFEVQVLEEDERTVTLVNVTGQTQRIFKNEPTKMPLYLDQPVKDRASWQQYKKRLDPDAPGRWPDDWEGYVAAMNEVDSPVALGVGSFFGFLREWMGLEALAYAFYDDPAWVEDMMDTMLDLELVVVERALSRIKSVDFAMFWEDMAYKVGPLISPAMFRQFMLPRYRKLTDLIRKFGVDLIMVDSDGDIRTLIPLWLEGGVNGFFPLEVAAGMDAVALRQEYGKDIWLIGNIDKRELAKGPREVRAEVLKKLPYLLQTGGYFPCVDHAVPPDVSFENFKLFTNTMREVAGLPKLAF